MPTHHFAAADYLAIIAGFCLFSLIAFLPGYAVGFLTNVLRFRTRTLPFRLAASVPLAVAIGPILAYTVGRWLSLTAVLGIYAALSAYTLYLAGNAIRNRTFSLPVKKLAPFLGLIAIWLVIALGSLADLQIGRRLYFTDIAFDYAVRTEFIQSINTNGIPAQNPFFFPGHPVALRYHYFWLILCSLVQRLSFGFVDARQALIAGSMWCGIGLICLIPLYLRVFSPQGVTNLYRRSMIGIALLGVTGLDILGTLLMLWLAHIGVVRGISPSVEMWNNQIDGWICTLLWEPHYLCALLACLTGFLALWDVPAESSLRRRVVPGIVAGLAFASATGAGIYVVMVFAAFLALWTLITVTKRWYRETAMLAIAGATAVACTIPYLWTMQESTQSALPSALQSTGKAAGAPMFQLTIRSFDLVEMFLRVVGLDRLWQALLGDLVMLPLNYFLELGVFFVVGWTVWKKFRTRNAPATRQELAGFTMAATSIIMCTFIRSNVIASNDFGWRGFLPAQFVLLLWAADMFSMPEAIPEATRSLLRLCLILGIAGVLYDLAMLRFFAVLSDAGLVPKIEWQATDQKLGQRTYANREAYEWLRARTSSRAIIQQNPKPIIQDTFWGMYGQRQVVAEDQGCGIGFGGAPDECAPIVASLDQLFSNGTSASLEAACRNLPVDVFIAKDTDPVWQDRSSWVWSRTSIFQNDFVRLFPCHSDPVVAAER